MAAPKGNKFSHGKPFGSRNKKTQQWEAFSAYILSGGLDKLQKELNSLKGKQYVDSMISFMEFLKPKLARVVDVNGNDAQLGTNMLVLDMSRLQNMANEISKFKLEQEKKQNNMIEECHNMPHLNN